MVKAKSTHPYSLLKMYYTSISSGIVIRFVNLIITSSLNTMCSKEKLMNENKI